MNHRCCANGLRLDDLRRRSQPVTKKSIESCTAPRPAIHATQILSIHLSLSPIQADNCHISTPSQIALDDVDGEIALNEIDRLRQRIFRRNRDQHMNVIPHHLSSNLQS
jgi:hypothetical protein